MGMRPAIASISIVSEVWNTLRIYNKALCCILSSLLRRCIVVMPQRKAIKGNGENTYSVKETFLIW